MVEHSESFKCEHGDKNVSTRKDLKEHIFMDHKSTINCSFFIRGNCTRECGFSHPPEVKYCRYSSKCPFIESGGCRYFHKKLPMWKNVSKKTNPETTHGERTWEVLFFTYSVEGQCLKVVYLAAWTFIFLHSLNLFYGNDNLN